MNKRIKLKKGILHKKCDCRCDNFLIILDRALDTNNCCHRCNLKNESRILDLLKRNRELKDFTSVIFDKESIYKYRLGDKIINEIKKYTADRETPTSYSTEFYYPFNVEDLYTYIKRHLKKEGLEVVEGSVIYESSNILPIITFFLVIEVNRKGFFRY